MNLDKLFPIIKPGSGCDYHRIVLPLEHLGYDFKLLEGLTTEKFKTFTALMFNRVPKKAKLDSLLEVRKQYGTKVIADFDDFWELQPSHYLYTHWKEEKLAEKMKAFMEISDVVTCTTQRLADKIAALNQKVIVVPNAMPVNTEDQFKDRKTPTTETRFGFVGGVSHAGDLKMIWPVFQHYNHLNFTFCGYSETSPQAKRMEDTCSNNKKNPNYKREFIKPLDKYMESYDNLDCCIAPLTDDYFNQFKSNLKVLEAGIKRCAIICSPNPCYTDTVPDNLVTYCKTIKDWKEAFRKHKDLNYTQEKGHALYDWVITNYNLEDANKTRLNIIQSL